MIRIDSQSEFTESSTKRFTTEDIPKGFAYQSKEEESKCHHQSRNKGIQSTLTGAITTDAQFEDSNKQSLYKTQKLQLLNEKEPIQSTHFHYTSQSSLKPCLQLPSVIQPAQPLEKQIWLKCSIERTTLNGKETYLLSSAKDKKYLLQAIKLSNGKFALNSFSLPIEQLGLMKSNFIGTNFALYANYEHSNREKCINVCSVIYDVNLFGMSGPNKLTALLPKPGFAFDRINTMIKSYEKDFTIAFKQMRCFTTVRPQYKKSAGFVLDYGEHKVQKSVKNFQLIEMGESDLILQFARTEKDSFILDFTYPLSPLQALFIAISAIERKIACE